MQPGGHRLPREVLERHQRERILAGAAKAIAAEGYRQASVADIVKSAAIARARFYENFSSKQDCFFSLYDEATEAALEVVSDACRQEEAAAEFAVRARSALEALVGHLTSDPVLARAIIVEGPAVGPPITSRFEGLIGGFAALVRQARPASSVVELPDTIEETVIGGLYWLLYYAFLEESPKNVDELLPQLTEFLLLPFVGAEAARRTGATK